MADLDGLSAAQKPKRTVPFRDQRLQKQKITGEKPTMIHNLFKQTKTNIKTRIFNGNQSYFGRTFRHFVEVEANIVKTDMVVHNCFNALLQLPHRHVFHPRLRLVLYLLENHLGRVETGRVLGEGKYVYPVLVEKFKRYGSLVAKVDGVDLQSQPGLRVTPLPKNLCLLLSLLKPQLDRADVMLLPIKARINLKKLNPFPGQKQHNMHHILLMQNMIHLPIGLQLHPHAALALIQSHMNYTVVYHPRRLAVQLP